MFTNKFDAAILRAASKTDAEIFNKQHNGRRRTDKMSTRYDQEAELWNQFRSGWISHAELQQHREALRNKSGRENAELKAARLKELEAEREARRKEEEAQFEKSLAPEKKRIKNEWLAQHPDRDEEDFEKKAWPRFRANLKAAAQQALPEEFTGRLLATGGYDF